MYIERSITEKLKYMAGKFPVVYLKGPRQSWKSTLLKTVFPDYNYVNLEETDLRTFANTDPRCFLDVSGKKLIIDEAQYAPVSSIQHVVRVCVNRAAVQFLFRHGVLLPWAVYRPAFLGT